jgi:hypothetical protein
MTLVTESGTGLNPAANTYIDATFFATYHEERGNTVTADDDAIEAAIFRAMDRLEYGYLYRGWKSTSTQPCEFPRSDLYDRYGRLVQGIPLALKRAQAELSLRALEGSLDPDLERGGLVTSESVGPISTSYSAGAPAGTSYPLVDKLLADLLVNGGSTSVALLKRA